MEREGMERQRDQIANMIPEVEEGSASRQRGRTDPNPEPEELGDLYDHAVLESLLTANRWLEAANYLSKSLPPLQVATTSAAAPPPPPSVVLHGHPELLVMLYRQHVLELLGERKYQEAQDFYNKSIFEPTRQVYRTSYVDTLISNLNDLISAGSDVEILPSRLVTCKNVQDYLRVYYPELHRGRRTVVESIVATKTLCSAKDFAEVTNDPQRFRCLVCHQTLTFRSDPFNHMVQHLHDQCLAVTPAVRQRLPRRNCRPKRRRSDEGDDNSHNKPPDV